MQKITPFLWFDDNAEEAANFYTSIFKNAKVGDVVRYSEAGPGPAGSVLTVSFEIEGLQFTALNGGPHFKFNEAVSFHVACESQEEVDYFWDRLGAGGQIQQCGWLKDKFGVSWQIVPDDAAEAARRSGSRQGEPGDAGRAADEEARYRGARTRCRLTASEPE